MQSVKIRHYHNDIGFAFVAGLFIEGSQFARKEYERVEQRERAA